jgi:hypothetical protein
MVALLAACSGGSKTPATTPCSGANCPAAAAADLTVTVDKPTMNSDGADPRTVTVVALDANRNIISGAPVTFSVDGTAIITPSSPTTDTTGTVTGVVGAGGDKTNRTITVTVTSGTIQKVVTIDVTGTHLTATAIPQILAPGAAGKVNYTLVDSAGNIIAHEAITVTGPQNATGVTDDNGHYEYDYTAPSAANSTFSVIADAAGASYESDLSVNGSGPIDPAVGAISLKSISANPSTVRVNAIGRTDNQVEVRVQILGPNEAPIKNMRVAFDLAGDANSVGGQFSSGPTGIVYTDDLGYARTQYIPAQKSSGPNKLTLRACYSHNDFTIASNANPSLVDCSVNAEGTLTTQITVANLGVNLSAFTDYKIIESPDEGTYKIRFTARVVDSAGAPISGVVVQAKPYQPLYYKGTYSVQDDPSRGGLQVWYPNILATCPNEDVNQSGTLDTYNGDPSQDEDANGTGALEPRAGSITMYPDTDTHPNGATTDEFGNAYFMFDYGQSVAGWSSYQITFTAIVDGTEGNYQLSGPILPVPSDVILAVATDPPFKQSPWGWQDGSGTLQPVTDPTTQTVYNLCTDPH